MQHPVAKCQNPACAAVFPCTAFAISNSRNVRFSGVQTNCPECGGVANVLDGTFDFVGDTIRLLSGPQATIDVLQQVAQVIRDSLAAGETAEKTFDRVTQVAPWLSSLKKVAKSQAVNLIWAGLSMIAGYEYTQYRDSQNAAQKREDQVAVYMDAARRDREAQEWLEFQSRMKEPLPAPPPITAPHSTDLVQRTAQESPKFPNTMAKLAEYAKQTRQRNK